jgi:flagellar motor switch protein FliM
VTTGTTVAPTSSVPSGASSGRTRRSVRPYDFRRPSKLSREHIRALQIAFETFGRQFTTILTSTLRVNAQVGLVSVQQMSYGEYIATLPIPSFMALISMQPLPGTALLQFGPETAMVCVDRLLGGPGAAEQPERPLTEIEQGIMTNLSQRVVHEMRYAFASLVAFTPQVSSLEDNPQFAQVAAAPDPVIVASYEMRVGNQDGVATLAMPFPALYPALEALTNAPRKRNGELAATSAALLNERLNEVAVEVGVQFDSVTLNPEQLLQLSPGDVLPLQHPTNRPLSVTTAGVTFARAVPGSKGKRMACLIVQDPDALEGENS